MSSRKEYQYKRVKVVANLVAEHYEAGNQSKSLLQIYKNVVMPVYPMGERTFWRYMTLAQEELGYTFSNDNFYLDETFESMRPETIRDIKNLANYTLRIGVKNKTKKEIYDQNSGFFGITYNVYLKYINIAEIYLGYKFNFKAHNRVKERKQVQKANYIINFK